MEAAITNNTAKAIFPTYINVLRKYDVEYFKDTNIRDVIQHQSLLDFNEWRIKKLGKVPAKSTVNTYNSALQRVLDEAVINGLLTNSEIPVLQNNGLKGVKRSAFTKDEYKLVIAEADRWISEGRKAVTRDIREMLYYYLQIGIYTGMRVGSEMDNLIWSDIVVSEKVNKKNKKQKRPNIGFTIRKGKTIQYTGTRKSIAKVELYPIIEKFILKFKVEAKKKDDDLIFGGCNEFGRNFTKILENLNLKTDAFGERTLYSLRHSYITWELLDARLSVSQIAAQCRTSAEMIEKHYNHLVPDMFADELSGREN